MLPNLSNESHLKIANENRIELELQSFSLQYCMWADCATGESWFHIFSSKRAKNAIRENTDNGTDELKRLHCPGLFTLSHSSILQLLEYDSELHLHLCWHSLSPTPRGAATCNTNSSLQYNSALALRESPAMQLNLYGSIAGLWPFHTV